MAASLGTHVGAQFYHNYISDVAPKATSSASSARHFPILPENSTDNIDVVLFSVPTSAKIRNSLEFAESSVALAE